MKTPPIPNSLCVPENTEQITPRKLAAGLRASSEIVFSRSPEKRRVIDLFADLVEQGKLTHALADRLVRTDAENDEDNCYVTSGHRLDATSIHDLIKRTLPQEQHVSKRTVELMAEEVKKSQRLIRSILEPLLMGTSPYPPEEVDGGRNMPTDEYSEALMLFMDEQPELLRLAKQGEGDKLAAHITVLARVFVAATNQVPSIGPSHARVLHRRNSVSDLAIDIGKAVSVATNVEKLPDSIGRFAKLAHDPSSHPFTLALAAIEIGRQITHAGSYLRCVLDLQLLACLRRALHLEDFIAASVRLANRIQDIDPQSESKVQSAVTDAASALLPPDKSKDYHLPSSHDVRIFSLINAIMLSCTLVIEDDEQLCVADAPASAGAIQTKDVLLLVEKLRVQLNLADEDRVWFDLAELYQVTARSSIVPESVENIEFWKRFEVSAAKTFLIRTVSHEHSQVVREAFWAGFAMSHPSEAESMATVER